LTNFASEVAAQQRYLELKVAMGEREQRLVADKLQASDAQRAAAAGKVT